MATIMIADHSRLLQRHLTMALQGAGYNLVLANDGLEALARITRETVDLILLERDLPKLDAATLSRLLRANEAGRDIPLFLLEPEESLLNRDQIPGLQGRFVKPLNTEELIAAINRVLAPLPEASQMVAVLLPNGSTLSEGSQITRVQDGALIHLRADRELGVSMSQQLILRYSTSNGILVDRHTIVKTGSGNTAVLQLSGGVTVQQRRRFFRKEVALPVRYRLPNDFFRLGRTVDLSGGGMKVEDLSGALVKGIEIEFQLVLGPGVQLPLRGAIRHLVGSENERWTAGIEFVDLDPRVQTELTMFLFSGVWTALRAAAAD